MSKIEIRGSELSEAITAAETMKKTVSSSLKKAQALKNKVNSSKWSGKAQESFVAYLDLICQYHDDLDTSMSKQKKALENLEKSISSFDGLPAPSKVRSL